jgi:hypothetical protein
MACLKHVALVKFKASTSEKKIGELFLEIQRLKDLIPGIVDFAWGRNNSSEGLHQGFTHGFVMTLKDAAARDTYLPHPEHERVKQVVLPHVDSVLVFDFNA